jgi:hypothetical protein
VRPEHRLRWEQEISRQVGPLKTPGDLRRRSISSEDFVDTAIIGGVTVADILAGKLAEMQIPSDVQEAFHAQFPQHGSSFVDAVNHLAGHPDRLAGLISGVKGKLFEIDYVKWLNSGHLPTGWTAELAQHANNPAWDISIHDGAGHLNEVLQLKATESLAYVKEAIAAHPDIDVVVPHELYGRLAENPEMLSHIVDGHESFDHLTSHAASAAEHAEAAGIHFHLPVIAIGFAAYENFSRYRNGNTSLEEALQNFGERSLLATVAGAAGWGAAILAHASLVGIPVSMAARLAGGQLLHNRRRRALLTRNLETVVSSRKKLQDQLGRCLLEPKGAIA